LGDAAECKSKKLLIVDETPVTAEILIVINNRQSTIV
jgi:hypothetical protein